MKLFWTVAQIYIHLVVVIFVCTHVYFSRLYTKLSQCCIVCMSYSPEILFCSIQLFDCYNVVLKFSSTYPCYTAIGEHNVMHDDIIIVLLYYYWNTV